MITILITGVGGPVGQAIVKAARGSAIPCRVVGTDRSPLAVGLGWVDSPHVIPDASRPEEYLAVMRRICAVEGAALLIPGSESELELLATHAAGLRGGTGAMVVASTPGVLRMALDKAETCLFLERAGLNRPRWCHLDDVAASERLMHEFGFPLIVKPCRGSGSRGLTKVRSSEDLRYLRTQGGRLLLQEYLQPDEEEYTVAVYTQGDGTQAGSICFRRELVAGNTYRAWVDQNPVVLEEAEAVARALAPRGPCNVQLRLTPRGPVTFEINPRFSGSTAMRAHFGYNEVEMTIRDFVLQEPVPAPAVRRGIALRFWDEVYFGADGAPERGSGMTREGDGGFSPAHTIRKS